MVGHLNIITGLGKASIVVHSSWRWGRTVEELRQILRSWGVKGTVLDATPSPIGVRTLSGIVVPDIEWAEFKGEIPSDDERCISIQKWLDAHPEIERYAILEDSTAVGYFKDRPEYIQTEINVGLTEEHVARALRVLR